MKNWVIIIVLLVGGYFGYQQYKAKQSGSGSSETDISQRKKTAPIQKGDIEFSVTVAGEITPAEQVSVRPEVNGRIKELPVDIGDRVKKGDLLFTLDDRDIQIEIESRQTEIQSAQLQLDKASRDYERDAKLFEEKLISKEVFDNSRTTYELAQNAIERSQNNLNLVTDRLSRTRILAPFDCTILTRPVSVGQAVSGSGGFNSGTEVLTIANLSRMIINAHVNQADVIHLKPNLKVQIKVEAVSGLTINGEVERIAPQATIRQNIKGFETRILLTEVDERVQPGMTANITIPVTSAIDVLSVPLAAVFTEDTSSQRYVYLKKGEMFEKTSVQIGVSDYFNAEVTSGVKEGDVVALEMPDENLISGEKKAAGGAGGKPKGPPAGGAK